MKSYIKSIGVICLAVMLAVCVASCNNSEQKTLSAEITVDCTRVSDKLDESYGVSNGYAIKDSKVSFRQGDTLLEVFEACAKENKLHFDNSDGYISGIANVYAGDFGDMSGWLYYVNGEIPEVGAGEYILCDGDKAEFVYFVDFNEAFAQ